MMDEFSRRTLVAATAVLALAASLSAAQAQAVRIRGTIEQIDGPTLQVRSRDGASVTARMADNVRLTAMVKAALSDLQPNVYIGITAMPQSDGSQKAIAIHIFRDSQRGTGEGHGPWDLQPGSTMTNASVETSVAGLDGQVVTVKYKQGDKVDEKKVIVTPQTVIVRYVDGSRDDLKPGVRVFLNNARKNADGTIDAPTVSYGRDGVTPPM
jgi:hypothetical protein